MCVLIVHVVFLGAKPSHTVDISGTVVGECPDCLLLSGTVVSENPDHVCWAQIHSWLHNQVTRIFNRVRIVTTGHDHEKADTLSFGPSAGTWFHFAITWPGPGNNFKVFRNGAYFMTSAYCEYST